jgi:flagellar protein FliT
MSTSNILTVYAEIMQVSHQMLKAAEVKDWKRLEMLEGMCKKHIEQLQAVDRRIVLCAGDIDRKMLYLNQILEDDRQIRLLLEPWMESVMSLMRKGASHD